MLSVAGRAALRRLGAGASSRSFVISRVAAPAPHWQALKTLHAVRLYASVGRPTKSSTTKTTKKPAAGKTATTTKPKAKKAAKKKPAAAKPKVRKPAAKKPATPASLERKEAALRRQLKKTALFTEPKPLPETAWRVFVVDKLKGQPGTFQDQAAKMIATAEAFKALSPSEAQRYASIAEENVRANNAAYKAWVESHTTDEMNNAMNARARLKRDYNYPKGNVKLIKDSRMPKRPITAYAFFTRAKWASGELTQQGPIGENAAAISAEWKSLSASERQPYEDLQRAESQRYEKDHEAAFGRKPEQAKKSPEP
ncbi:hypothetical protein Micbo1qcDRAFT_192708 [Microdochium bolleyi]|uniref:HMG box domain-containing protein n=1 Tax=Microdochium bolleyi TaxID=196109 RepID=A0A136JF84_9PEZI|nr:hypothetical protein Micbo1qcDRAFT_192708 [Microdochium bolleyi]